MNACYTTSSILVIEEEGFAFKIYILFQTSCYNIEGFSFVIIKIQ